MVTHEPRAAAIADRILFLADGLIVRDLPRWNRTTCWRRWRRSRPGDQVRAEEPRRQEAKDRPHCARDRPRRGDDERRLRADGHDRQGVRRDLRRLVRRHRRRRDGQGPRLQLRGRVGTGSSDPRGDARSACARSTASRSPPARFRTSRRSCCGRTARRSTRAARRRSRSGSRPSRSTTASTRSTSSRAAGPAAAARWRSTRASPATRSWSSATGSASRHSARRSSSRSSGSPSTAT